MRKTSIPETATQLLDKQQLACDTTQAAKVSDGHATSAHNSGLNAGLTDRVNQSSGKVQLKLDKLTSHILWRETNNRVEELRARVREGVDVLPASEFARWLRFSGILQLLPENPQPLECYGAALSLAVEELVSECGRWFTQHERARIKPHAQIPRTELERINAQLAHLTVQLSKLSPPTSDTANAGPPALQVIAGGVV